MYIAERSRENQKDLLKELVKTNFKLRYNNSILGVVWVLMKPFLSFLILFVVFTAFRGGEPNAEYAANLLLGIIVFTLVQEGIIFGMHSLLDIASVILKINFPRHLAVTSAMLMALINFGLNMIIIIIISLITMHFPTLLGIIYFISIIILLFAILYSVSLFSSILLVKIRDLDHIVDLGMQLLFWGSAVFYNLDDMQGTFGKLLKLNPFAIMIDSARKAIIKGEIAHLKYFIGLAAISIILYVAGRIYFKSNIKKIAEHF